MTLRLYFRKGASIPPNLTVETNLRLQSKGSDYRVYANNGYTPAEYDRPVLQEILGNLFKDDSGVRWAEIEPYSIDIHYSSAVSYEELKSRVIEAATVVYGGEHELSIVGE